MHDVASEQTSRQVKGMLVVNEQLGDEMVLAESCVKIRTPDLISDISLSFVLGLDLAGRAPLNFGLDIVCTTSGRRKPAGMHLMESDCSRRRCFSVL